MSGRRESSDVHINVYGIAPLSEEMGSNCCRRGRGGGEFESRVSNLDHPLLAEEASAMQIQGMTHDVHMYICMSVCFVQH